MKWLILGRYIPNIMDHSRRKGGRLACLPAFICIIQLISVSLFAQPAITSFTPASGPIGTAVVITGSNFSPTPSANIVFFGAARATVLSASTTSLSVTVPAGTSYQPVTVTVNNLTGSSARPFVTTFNGVLPIVENINLRQTTFEPGIDMMTDLHPNGMAMADLDGDGRVDIATANNYSINGQPASLSILRNTGTAGTISFSSVTNIPTGVMAYAIALGDLDGDGKPDMVSSSIVDQSISVFRNTSGVGSISFGAAVNYATGQDPFGIAIADLDLDGRPDLIVTNYLSGSVSLFRNTTVGGIISFASRVDLGTGFGPRVVVAGDLDGDGKPDLAVSNDLSNTVSVFRNSSTPGNISFSTGFTLAASGSPYGVAIGDLDADGRADLVVVNNTKNSYSIFKNTSSPGAIAFAAKADYGCGASPFNVSIGDVNGDGQPDIAVASDNLSVSQNIGTPGSILMTGPNYLYPGIYPFMVVVGDLDGDGKNDIVTTDFTSNKITLFRNRNNEPMISAVTPTDAVAGSTITLSGYNFTGATGVSFGGVAAASFVIAGPDTIRAVAGNGASGYVGVSNQYGTGRLSGFNFHAPPVILSFTPVNAGTGDTIRIQGKYLTGVTTVSFGGTSAASFRVNSDSSVTAIVAGGASGSLQLTTVYGSGSLAGFTYFPPPVISSFTPGGGGIGTTIQITGNFLNGATSVTIGGTPAASFIVNSPTSLTATVAEGADGGIAVTTPGGMALSGAGFAFPLPSITAISPNAGAIGSTVTITGSNFRSDAAANIVTFGAAIARVTAASTSSLTVIVPAGTTLSPITVTVNNHTVISSNPFLATYAPGATTLTDSSFGWRGAFATSEDDRMVLSADLDGDGKPDLVTMNLSVGTVSILKNMSSVNNPSFVRQVDLTLVGGSVGLASMAIGDVNGDGKPDIVLVGFNYVVDIFKNISSGGVIAFAAPVVYPTAYFGYGVTLGDFDGDKRIDMAIGTAGFNGDSPSLSIYHNIGRDGNISFAPKVDLATGDFGFQVDPTDLDGDGRPDLVGTGNAKLTVLRNTSTPGSISFDAPQNFTSNVSQSIAIADLDGDGKPDLISAGGDLRVNQGLLSVLKNTSTPGAISFAAKIDLQAFPGYVSFPSVYAGQLDGDGRPDLVVMNMTRPITLFRNTGGAGTLSFARGPDLYPRLTFNFVDYAIIGDLDGDGKADIAVANSSDRVVSFYRNQAGENLVRLCETASTSIGAAVTGSTYQWQVNADTGFVNLKDDSIYSGTVSPTLKLSGIPYSLDGHQYRCLVDGIAGDLSKGTVTNLSVDPAIRFTGLASSPGKVCADSNYAVIFSPTSAIPFNSNIEFWASDNGGAPVKLASKNYVQSALGFPITDSVGTTKSYFFRIIPANPAACQVPTQTDTTSTIVTKLQPPVLSLKDSLITIANPDPSAVYAWQVLDAGGNWGSLSGVAGISVNLSKTGNYRVVESKTGCSAISNAENYVKPVITINPPPPATDSAVHIQSYPNPATTTFVIDSLNLSDGWATLEIIHVADGRRIRILSIAGQTTVTLSIGDLEAGIYVAVLRRRTGGPVTIRFLKV